MRHDDNPDQTGSRENPTNVQDFNSPQTGMGLNSRKSSGPVAKPHQQAGHRTVSDTGTSKASQIILAKREPSTQDVSTSVNTFAF